MQRKPGGCVHGGMQGLEFGLRSLVASSERRNGKEDGNYVYVNYYKDPFLRCLPTAEPTYGPF